MWSATWPRNVQKLAGDFLGSTDFIHVNIGSDQLTANHDILQIIDVCSEYEKTGKMVQLFNEILGNGARPEENKIIVFAQTKRKVDDMTLEMRRNGYVTYTSSQTLQYIVNVSFFLSFRYSAKCIHGDKSQEEREYVLQEFRQGEVTILVATDVAARGLGNKAADIYSGSSFKTKYTVLPLPVK